MLPLAECDNVRGDIKPPRGQTGEVRVVVIVVVVVRGSSAGCCDQHWFKQNEKGANG